MNIYVFDMDGTLTPARQPMKPDFARRFIPWVKAHIAYLAAGSNYEKVAEQLPADAITAFSGIYSSMGNVFHQKNKEVYRQEIKLKKELLQTLEAYRKNTLYQGKLYGNYLELRPGMLNFSVLGRNCPFEARADYNAWDNQNHERETMACELNRKFPEYEISLGGKISLDIVTKGFGKEQIANKIRQAHPNDKIIFFGDRTAPGGNDYALAQALLKMENTEVIAVNTPEDVLTFLEI
ncbi:MAG: HAD-IIB family hydrolase [Alphaproteobacteria bacterium]|nr:HAD-IIB family hydrolase [Alphaproteobacteria bacterium]